MSSVSAGRSICVFSRIPGLGQHVISKLPRDNIKSISLPPKEARLPYIATTEDLKILKECEILFVDPILIADNNLTQELPQLKWMQSTWAGVDSLVKSIDHSKPLPEYTLTRYSGSFGPVMSEYVIGQIIARERDFAGMMEQQHQSSWKQLRFGKYRLLSELTLGILGVGDIGKHIAKIAKQFGMKVWGLVRQHPGANGPPEHLDECRLTDQLPELLSQCDYICNVLPATKSTTGLLGADVLRHCKPKSSVFINVGRGNVVEEAEIIKALEQKWLSHAILDVFGSEPLASDSPLWLHPQVTISPHVAAMSLMDPVSAVFVKNLKRLKNGQPLLYVASFEAGY